MLLNLSQKVYDRKGTLLKADATSDQLGDFLYNVATCGIPGEALDVASKRKRVVLMNKVTCNCEVELTPEEVATLTDACALIYAPVFFGALDAILNPPAEA